VFKAKLKILINFNINKGWQKVSQNKSFSLPEAFKIYRYSFTFIEF